MGHKLEGFSCLEGLVSGGSVSEKTFQNPAAASQRIWTSSVDVP